MTDRTPSAYFPADCRITIQKKGQTPKTVTTLITNYGESGGTKDTETITHFGDAYLTVKKAQENYEVSFDVDIVDTDWEEVMSDDVASVGSPETTARMITSAGRQMPYKVKLEFLDSEYPGIVGSPIGSVGAGYKILYYNAYGVSLEKDTAADERLKGTMTFRVAPADNQARGQKREIECRDFSDSEGSTTYNSWEGSADSEFGFDVA